MLVTNAMGVLLLLGLVASTVSVTISSSALFEPVRAYINRKGPEFLSALIYCYHCLGYWAALLVFILVPACAIITENNIVNLLVNYFVLAGITLFLGTLQMLCIFQLKKLKGE